MAKSCVVSSRGTEEVMERYGGESVSVRVRRALISLVVAFCGPFVWGDQLGTLKGMSSGLVRQGHSVVAPGNYQLNQFEMQPFAIDLAAPEPVNLLVGVEGSGAQFVSIDTAQFDGFVPQILFLEDDGFPPDEMAGDGVFTGTLVPQERQSLPGGQTHAARDLRVVELIVHGNGAVDETLVVDVAYSFGVIDGRVSIGNNQIAEAGEGFVLSDRVVNITRPEFLTGTYPSIGVDEQAVSRAVIEQLGDRFDWIVFFGAYNYRAFPVSDHTLVRNGVAGIGQRMFDESERYGSNGVLRSVLGVYRKKTDELTHHIFHTWGVYGVDRLGINSSLGGPGHWGALASSGHRSVFGFPGILSALNRQENGTYCGALGVGPVFDWELYLMGLIPLEHVTDATFLTDSSLTGFACEGYAFSGAQIETLNGNRWVEVFGERKPAYPDINRFKAAMVVVTDRLLQSVEFEYVERLAIDHEHEFARAYDQLAFLSYQFGNDSQPTLRGSFLSPSEFAIRLSGPPGVFELETSSNLVNWNPLTVPAPTGEAVVRREVSDSNEQWFLRWKP